MPDVLNRLSGLPEIDHAVRLLQTDGVVRIGGTAGSATALVAACLTESVCTHALVVCARGEEAEEFAEDMNLLRSERACCFPALDVLPGDVEEPDEGVLRARLTVLRHLAMGETPERATDASMLGYLEPGPETRVVVTSVRAMLQPTSAPDDLRSGSHTLALGEEADPTQLVEWLAANGYVPQSLVCRPGQYCLRGGILDVYSHGAPDPVRIEFFGDEVDSIRTFDPSLQTSTGRIERCRMTVAEHGGASSQPMTSVV